MVNITDELVHFLLVGFSLVVLSISILAYASRKETRYLLLSLAFVFLTLAESVGLIEAVFLSNQLVFIPSTGIHLSHLLEFLMLSSFGLALLTSPKVGS